MSAQQRPCQVWPTRGEVAAAVAPALSGGGASKDELLAAAVGQVAVPAVIDLLRGLPARRYRDVDDVLAALPDLRADHAG